jgi:hypothetical protein
MIVAEIMIVMVTGAIAMLSMAMIALGDNKNINLWAGVLFFQMGIMAYPGFIILEDFFGTMAEERLGGPSQVIFTDILGFKIMVALLFLFSLLFFWRHHMISRCNLGKSFGSMMKTLKIRRK